MFLQAHKWPIGSSAPDTPWWFCCFSEQSSSCGRSGWDCQVELSPGRVKRQQRWLTGTEAIKNGQKVALNCNEEQAAVVNILTHTHRCVYSPVEHMVPDSAVSGLLHNLRNRCCHTSNLIGQNDSQSRAACALLIAAPTVAAARELVSEQRCSTPPPITMKEAPI